MNQRYYLMIPLRPMVPPRRAPLLPHVHARHYASQPHRTVQRAARPEMPDYAALPPHMQEAARNIISCDRISFCLSYIGDTARAAEYKKLATHLREVEQLKVPSIEFFLDTITKMPRDQRDMDARTQLAESFGLTRRIAEINDFPVDIMNALTRLHLYHTSTYFKV